MYKVIFFEIKKIYFKSYVYIYYCLFIFYFHSYFYLTLKYKQIVIPTLYSYVHSNIFQPYILMYIQTYELK